jgi:hypothetical protein
MAARVQRGLRARIKEALGGALEGERVCQHHLDVLAAAGQGTAGI